MPPTLIRAALIAALACVQLHAASTNAPPASLDLPDAGGSILRVLGALVLVLTLFFAGVWFIRNWQGFLAPAGRRPRKLQVLEMKSLGPRQAVFLVGYENQRMLLASSPAGVTLVAHLPEADPSDQPSEPPKTTFGEVIQQVLTRR